MKIYWTCATFGTRDNSHPLQPRSCIDLKTGLYLGNSTSFTISISNSHKRERGCGKQLSREPKMKSTLMCSELNAVCYCVKGRRTEVYVKHQFLIFIFVVPCIVILG